MHRMVLGIPMAGGIALLLGLSAVSAAPVTGSVRDATVQPGVVELVQERSGCCRRLRRACEFKDERGERSVKATAVAIAVSAGAETATEPQRHILNWCERDPAGSRFC